MDIRKIRNRKHKSNICFGHNGVKEYFNRTCLENNHDLRYERLASTLTKNINGVVDIYEIFDDETNQKICELYICIYNKHTSKVIPKGFKLKEK